MKGISLAYSETLHLTANSLWLLIPICDLDEEFTRVIAGAGGCTEIY